MASTYESILNFVDGKPYWLDGVSGTLKVRRYQACYPYEHERVDVCHEADALGKRSPQYREVRGLLHDDYVTDLTWSEALVDIAVALGYQG